MTKGLSKDPKENNNSAHELNNIYTSQKNIRDHNNIKFFVKTNIVEVLLPLSC